MDFEIFPIGDRAATLSFGNVISPTVNEKVLRLAAAVENSPFPGFIECLPAYASLSVYYDAVAARRAFPESETAFAAVAEYLAEAMLRLSGGRAAKKRAVEIPISFAEEDALDLPDILRAKRLSKTEFIDIFTAWTYRVFMVGFLPGFAYMGEVDERIATPRRQTPRTKVPQGSVGIAGSQTGIYPFDSPGGWQIVGRTRLEMFLLEREPNCLLQAGDEVRFVVKKV